MKCDIQPLNLKLKREFVVSGGRERLKHNFLVIINDVGLGEAAGSIQYGATPDDIRRDLEMIADRVGQLRDNDTTLDLAAFDDKVCAPARCAFSTAWHDWLSKRRGVPLSDRFGLSPSANAKTSVTVSIGDMEALKSFLGSGHESIKVKMGPDIIRNKSLLRVMRASAGVRFRIDANAGWNFDDATLVLEELPAEKIELIEQPFPAGDTASWMRLKEISPVPLIMNESIATADDVRGVADYVDGVNIKIQKSGRLEAAIETMKTARALHLKVMLGCMIESSVGIAAAYHLAALADYLDLDGRFLVEADPFVGLSYRKGRLTVSGEYGHGISLA